MRKRVHKQQRLPKKGWHREDIKAEVRKRGWTLVQIDECYDLTRGSAQCALWHPHFHGEMAIAEVLQLSPRQLWPERFQSNGERKHQIRNRSPGVKNNSNASNVNRQNSRHEVA